MNQSFNRRSIILLCKLLLFIFLSLGLSYQVNAQLNIKTGYSFSFNNPEVSSQLFNDFNQANEDWLDNEFKEFRWMHGIHLGLRYRFADMLGFEAGWMTKFDRTDVSGAFPGTGDAFYRKYFYTFNQAHVGLELITNERIGIGASLNYDIISMKSRHSEKGDKLRVFKKNSWSSNFFLTFYTTPSNGVGFAIRPYVRVPWTEINYLELSNDLNETTETTELNDKTIHIGISLLFFNGN